MTQFAQSEPKTLNTEAVNELYRLMIDKCYRINLLDDLIDPQTLYDAQSSEEQIHSDLENNLAQALLPRINRILDKGLVEIYHILDDVDVDEDYIKGKIMDLKNTSMIPSIIAFAIIDRLKRRYKQYPLLRNTKEF